MTVYALCMAPSNLLAAVERHPVFHYCYITDYIRYLIVYLHPPRPRSFRNELGWCGIAIAAMDVRVLHDSCPPVTHVNPHPSRRRLDVYEQAALGDAPLRARIVDVKLALALEHERLLRGVGRQREAGTDRLVGRVEVEVEHVERWDGENHAARLDVERRGGDRGVGLP